MHTYWHLSKNKRLNMKAGIAIGPILFVIALLAVLAAVMSVGGSSGFGTASVADRISADVQSQANLIRSKIMECNTLHGTDSNYDGYPSSDPTTGTLVSALNCTGDPGGQQGLWNGARVTMLPAPTAGFDNWHYINTDATGTEHPPVHGICVWTSPTTSNPKSNAGIVEGLKKAASKFSNDTAYNSAAEVIYDPASNSQKFVLWITLPTGSPDTNCTP